ncbi:serine hydrolase domain-containing protein, partial [Actinoplanes sp. NPDC048791]|uniref:serine hydrolase domain-containing protein n=1 Tax=Actinoplanes sp. NPDC048791 TaxID=3154623 RepID=UPI00340F7009
GGPPGSAQAGPAGHVDLGAVQRALDQAVAAGVPGIVYLVRDGARSTVLTSGKADVSTGRPVTANDRFRIDSITKTYLATVVLQLQAEHRLNLDAPVGRWLPGLLPGGDRITARHLLGHTSGLFDYAEDPRFDYRADPLRVWDPVDLVRLGTSHPLLFTPGAGYTYSNTGYVVLGLLVERITGQKLERVLDRRILRPLDLRHTWFATGSAIRGRHAHGYTVDPTGLRDITRIDASHVWATGALIATPADVATFFRALLGGRVLPARQLAEMKQFRDSGDGYDYGLGLMKRQYACAIVLGHAGGGLGFSTDAVQTTDGTRQAVVFANTDTIPDAAYQWFQKAADLTFCTPR